MRNALVILSCMLLLHGLAHGDIPKILSYQGRMTDDSGNAVADGVYAMSFKIFDAAEEGTMLWDAPAAVQLSGGVFSVHLGESPQPALDLAFDEDYWLEVEFNGELQAPRQRLTSAGYAYMASGLVSGTIVSGTGSYVLAADNTNSDGYGIGLFGQATGMWSAGVYGSNSSPYGRGVWGEASATTGPSCSSPWSSWMSARLRGLKTGPCRSAT